VAKVNGLEIEVVNEEPAKGVSAEYIKNVNGLGKVPSFVGADGFVLSECIAIAVYRMSFLCNLVFKKRFPSEVRIF
jgi:elongation factor 1-gamma